ncbi:MAG TPA: hypothetical protein VLE99_01255 [Candidatus Saccharimonadales bacterium]|nr:hypothetical protein [Candidatus Saccharimonadales bacterium]
MTITTGTIINDCTDDLARSRQDLRFKTLFGVQPTYIGVGSYEPIEAAGNLLDVLDVLCNFPLSRQAAEHVILVNVAPRGEDVKQEWDNGTPFCYFRTGNVLVVSTYEERSLALFRDLGIVNAVELLDTPTVTAAAVKWGELAAQEADKINNSQFRSLEFLPLVAYWTLQGRKLPSTTQPLTGLASNDAQVWHVDNFEDVKTTLLSKDVDFEQGKVVTLAGSVQATCYRRLTDVPQGVTALTIGSSGYGSGRFLEIVIGHRGQAASTHNLKVGTPLLPNNLTDKVK